MKQTRDEKNQSEIYDYDVGFPEYIDSGMVTILKPYCFEAEQFRQVKTSILFPENGLPARTIMITSPSPDEGKSFVSANLAVSMAQSIDEYVLLMDCDLRSPSVHTMFGMDDPGIKGLSEYLANEIPLEQALHKTFIKKLTLLPSGAIPDNPAELISSEHMRNLVSEVRERYSDRYILIDTPPPYLTAETNAIARHVDGIILVVRHGKTRIKEVQDIIDIYGTEKILGVVRNFSEKTIGSDYPRYGGEYHRQGSYGMNRG